MPIPAREGKLIAQTRPCRSIALKQRLPGVAGVDESGGSADDSVGNWGSEVPAQGVSPGARVGAIEHQLNLVRVTQGARK